MPQSGNAGRGKISRCAKIYFASASQAMAPSPVRHTRNATPREDVERHYCRRTMHDRFAFVSRHLRLILIAAIFRQI
jgi:hypothetical protein